MRLKCVALKCETAVLVTGRWISVTHIIYILLCSQCPIYSMYTHQPVYIKINNLSLLSERSYNQRADDDYFLDGKS